MKDSSSSPPYAERQIRCPRLGGPVTFEYCRIENRGFPCSKAISCWSSIFEVEQFFRQTLSDEEFERCFCAPPKSKIDTLIELIEQARKTTDKKNQ